MANGGKKIVFAVLVGAIIYTLMSPSDDGTSSYATPSSAASAPLYPAPSDSAAHSPPGYPDPTITYEVTGSGAASSVTYSSDGSGGQSQQTDVSLPFRKQVPIQRFLGSYSLVAQNGGDGGTIGCRIRGSDGKVVAESESSGRYAVVTCTD